MSLILSIIHTSHNAKGGNSDGNKENFLIKNETYSGTPPCSHKSNSLKQLLGQE